MRRSLRIDRREVGGLEAEFVRGCGVSAGEMCRAGSCFYFFSIVLYFNILSKLGLVNGNNQLFSR